MYRLVAEIDTCVLEEVVSDIILQEVYKVDVEIHRDMQLEKQVIFPPTIYSAEDMGVTLSQPRLVKNMSPLPDKPIPHYLKHVTQPKVVSHISSLETSETQDKIITTTHAEFGKNMKLKLMNREGMWGIIEEIPTYINPVYRSSCRSSDLQNVNRGSICGLQ